MIDFEKALIGSCLRFPENISLIIDQLTEEDLSSSKLQAIYRAITSLKQKEVPLDTLTLSHELKIRAAGILDSEVIELGDSYIDGMDLHYYMKKVKMDSRRRKLHSFLSSAIKQIQDPLIEYPEMEGKLVQGITDILEYGKDQDKVITPFVSSLELISLPDGKAVEWVVKELIPKGASILITAIPGDYKTYFALVMANRVSEGKDFLGRATRKMRVIYVDRENPRDILSKRLKQIGASENFFFYPLWADPEPPYIFDPIYSELAADDVLFIFDSHKRFHKGDENSSADMSRVSEAFRRLTVKGATVVTLHHRGKSELQEYRGSSEIIAGVDVAFSIRRDQNILSFKCIKNRYIQEPHLTLEVQGDEDSFNIRDISDQKELTKELERREQILMIKEIILTLTDGGTPPVKTRILEECINAGIPKAQARDRLKEGEGSYWKVDSGARGANYYTVISTRPDFHSIGSGQLDGSCKPSESLNSTRPEGFDENGAVQPSENGRNLDFWIPKDDDEVVL
jgi:hypothetical protein